jgi:hypothetical protein
VEHILNLFSKLFKKSDWAKLNEFSIDVKEDISHLLALDALSRSAVQNNAKKLLLSTINSADKNSRLLAEKLNEKLLLNELYIALLSTGVGRSFEEIKWNKVAQATIIKLIGIVVMCEYRNNDQQTVDNDIKKSGYSFSSNEARTQFLVLLANAAKINDYDSLKEFDEKYFSHSWLSTRKFIFDGVQANVNAEESGTSLVAKERFQLHTKSRQETYLMLANSLAKKAANSEASKQQSAPAAPLAPFNAEQHKNDHPLLYIPHPKIMDLITQINIETLDFYKSLGINEYEMRRVGGIKDEVPSLMLNMIFMYDSSVLAYCSTVAAMQRKEPKFVGCGVWKAITESFQSDNMLVFSLMAGFRQNGALDVNAMSPQGNPKASLDLIGCIRKSANDFLNSNADVDARIKLLLQGTVVYRNLISYPAYSKHLASYIGSVFQKVEQQLGVLSKGELLSWEKQKDLK